MKRDHVKIPRAFIEPLKKSSATEKNNAKLIQKYLDHQMVSAYASTMLKTPWGTLTWTPKNQPKITTATEAELLIKK